MEPPSQTQWPPPPLEAPPPRADLQGLGPAQQRRQGWLRRTFGPVIAAIIAFFAKFKSLLLLLPKLKLVTTAGTMFVSMAAYAWLWGWQFAAGFVVLLLVHEMGHVIQLRREGLKASAPMFIPFMGAVISARSLGDNALAEARVGLAGPILGSIGAAACIGIWHATGNDMWRALAFTGFFLNLFNLLPVVPLDGGRAMAAMAPWMWFVGFAAMIPLLFVFPNPIFLIIIVFAALETTRRWRLRKAGGADQQAYYRVKPIDRALVATVYLSLIALLVVGMHATTLTRTFN
jgi:Zn-dependent protease